MRLNISPERYQYIIDTIIGYKKTGVPLVSWNGSKLKWVCPGDDTGLYYFVPKIAILTHTNAQQAFTIFFVGVMSIALLCGLTGLFLLYRGILQRLFCVAALTWATHIAYGVADVYFVSIALTVGIIPFVLWFQKQGKASPVLGLFLFVSGLAVSMSNAIRSQSGSPVLVFVVIIVFVGLIVPVRVRMALLLCLFCGTLLVGQAFSLIERRAETYLVAHQPGYTSLVHQHVLWHSIYIGLGYIKNDYGLSYDDQVAARKVRSVDSTIPYCSPAYERILRQAVFEFIQAHPGFVMKTLAMKIKVLLFVLIRYANIGLFYAWRFRHPRVLDAAFYSALIVSMLPSLLVIPLFFFETSFMTFSLLYGLFCINSALDHQQEQVTSPGQSTNIPLQVITGERTSNETPKSGASG